MRNKRLISFLSAAVAAFMLCGCSDNSAVSDISSVTDSVIVDSGASEDSNTIDASVDNSEGSDEDSSQGTESGDASSDSSEESSAEDSNREENSSEDDSGPEDESSTPDSGPEDESSTPDSGSEDESSIPDSGSEDESSTPDSSEPISSEPESSDNESKARLTVGFDRVDYPMIYMEEDKLAGYMVDLMNAVADDMGVACEFKAIGSNMVEQELAEGTVSCVISSSYASYYNAGSELTIDAIENCSVFVVPADSDINSFTGIGKRITVKKSSPSEKLLLDIKFNGLVMIQTIPATEEKLELLADGRTPVFMSRAAAMHSVRSGMDYRFLPDEYGNYTVGLLLSSHDSALCAELKTAVNKQLSDGTLYNEWFVKN